MVEPLDLTLPFFLDDLDHVALVLGLEDGNHDFDGSLLDQWSSFNLFFWDAKGDLRCDRRLFF